MSVSDNKDSDAIFFLCRVSLKKSQLSTDVNIIQIFLSSTLFLSVIPPNYKSLTYSKWKIFQKGFTVAPCLRKTEETIMVQGSGTWQPWHIWGKTMHFPRTFSLQSCLSTTCQTAKPFPKYLFSLIFLCVRPMAFGYAYFHNCVVAVLFLVMVNFIR